MTTSQIQRRLLAARKGTHALLRRLLASGSLSGAERASVELDLAAEQIAVSDEGCRLERIEARVESLRVGR